MIKYFSNILTASTILALFIPVGANAVQHGYKVEFSDFSERLDSGDKFVDRKMLTYKKTWDATKQQEALAFNYHANIGAGFGRYRGGESGRDDYLSTSALETAVSTEHRVTASVDKGGLKPEIGLHGKLLAKRINHRVEGAVDAVAGMSYKAANGNFGARYHHNLNRTFYYPHGGEYDGAKTKAYTLDQSGGNSVFAFYEQQRAGKTHGIEIAWQQSPKGKPKNHGGWVSYEPRSEQYSIAYYVKY